MTIENKDNIKLEWTVHPLIANWKISAGLIAFLIALCTAIYFSFNSLTFLFLSIIFLVGSLSPFFFPTTYTLNDDGINIKSVFRKSSKNWGYYKSYYPDRNGILLSPFPHPSRLENFRGLYVRFNNNKADVVNFVKQKLKPGRAES
jgi:hypothetical protein